MRRVRLPCPKEIVLVFYRNVSQPVWESWRGRESRITSGVELAAGYRNFLTCR